MVTKSPIEIPELIGHILDLLDSLSLVFASFVCREWSAQTRRVRQRRGLGTKPWIPVDVAIRSVPILAWLVVNLNGGKIPSWLVASACYRAAKCGALESLQWLRARGAPWDRRTQYKFYIGAWAARNGHLEVLRWARAGGCSWDRLTCIQAAEGGQLAVLQWVRENGCSWDEAQGGKTSLFLHQSGRNGESRSFKVDPRKQQKNFVFFTNGCPWYKSECRFEAQRHGRWAVVRWINAEPA